MSLSLDEFIEILGEMYHTSYDTIETIKYYLDANDIIDFDTNLIHSSILTDSRIDEEFKLNLPMKLNDLYQTIKKLNGFSKLNGE
ncbi:unnamed protein product [Rotaria sp. Silwood1]|nr:unnamed protein product [Rotaria sp. Silwood1]